MICFVSVQSNTSDDEENGSLNVVYLSDWLTASSPSGSLVQMTGEVFVDVVPCSFHLV